MIRRLMFIYAVTMSQVCRRQNQTLARLLSYVYRPLCFVLNFFQYAESCRISHLEIKNALIAGKALQTACCTLTYFDNSENVLTNGS